MLNHNDSPALSYPEVPRRPMTHAYETPAGVVVEEDYYHWLGDLSDPAALASVKAQNAFTDQYFKQYSAESTLKRAFDALTNAGTTRSVGEQCGSRTYFMKNEPGNEFGKLMVEEDGVESVFYDPNAQGENTSLMWFNPSPDGNWMAYAVMKNDSENPEVYVHNMKAGTEALFYQGSHFALDWDADSQGFMYLTADGAQKKTSPYFYQSIYHHTLDKSTADALVLEAAATPIGYDANLGFEQSEDGRHVLIDAHMRDKQVKTYVLDRNTKEIRQLYAEVPGRHQSFLIGNEVFARVDAGDQQFVAREALVTAPSKPLSKWTVVVPPRDDHFIKHVAPTRSNLVVEYAHDVDSRVVLFDRATGAQSGELALPDHSGLCAINTNAREDNFSYVVGNALTSQSVFRYANGSSRFLFGAHHNLDPEDYDLVKVHYPSDDGTRVPLYLAAQRGVIQEQDAAVLMQCYGGFADGEFPEKQYTNLHRLWLELGQIVAIPCVRGGDELGKAWHEAAVRENKYRTVEDINAASRYLREASISQRVGLAGGSNGGLMALAAMLRAPKQYGSVEARVTLGDMLQYVQMGATAESWIKEFGDPRRAEDYEMLRWLSPYHTVKEGVVYPPTLLTGGLNDKRVRALHAIKQAALMQHLGPDNVTLLHVEMDTGHGRGKSASQWHAYYARRLAHHALHLSVHVPPDFSPKVANAAS